ncbi:DUF1524 domain-containing protein [Kocuria sp. CPCC 205300]|uniref:GmrSD restriction endonuclease domain-containing protein n=1 Tax=Kocuria sabuli TaxID=3071448 RepID=UPI0036DEECCA
MTPAPHPPADPGSTAFTSRYDVRLGKWLLAVPAHLTMVGSVLAVAVAVAPSALLAGSSPLPPTVATSTAAPTPTPSASRTAGTVVSASPEPTEGQGSSSATMDALEALTVDARDSMSDYDRYTKFGDWIDADGDCVNTRDEILARDLDDVVSDDGCRVTSGTLDDPYTGDPISFTRGITTSSDVQIDHVVASGNAWASGARNLSQAERVEFYNDPLNLLAVDGSVNGAKSDLTADEWLPPQESFQCEYVATQIAVKAKYELRVTASEKAAMADVLSTCPDQELPTGAPLGGMATASAASDRVSAWESPAPTAGAFFGNCTEARESGAAPLLRGSPGYEPHLDGDLDGVACED